MAKLGVDDAMFCEACGAHREQLGVAGKQMLTCPDCGRATCANCWNQLAAGCLACRAFALPLIAARAPARQRPTSPPASASAAATAKPKASTRRFQRVSRPQPDPAATMMRGVAENAPILDSSRGAGARVNRFGKIRLGRVLRASAIGSVLAVSVVTVVFAGVINLGPGGTAGSQRPPSGTEIPDRFGTDPGGATTVPEGSAPVIDETAHR